MVQGKINSGRHTNHPAGRHFIRTNQCPPPPSSLPVSPPPSLSPCNFWFPKTEGCGEDQFLKNAILCILMAMQSSMIDSHLYRWLQSLCRNRSHRMVVKLKLDLLFVPQLLLPLDIDIHSTAPQSSNHHIEVFVTDIVMNVTASSVRTLMATLTSLTTKKVWIMVATLCRALILCSHKSYHK